MYKLILVLAIMATIGVVQLPLAFATPPPTAPPSTPGCTGNPHGGFLGGPATGNPHDQFLNPTGNPHIGIVAPGVGLKCPIR